ncbi:hypothetical protein EDD85DRAFT_792656 [Armillaria nabsnona]|nr:hypothetical protein EDD85DRAFT_792656 [Armillaria nabsnona]
MAMPVNTGFVFILPPSISLILLLVGIAVFLSSSIDTLTSPCKLLFSEVDAPQQAVALTCEENNFCLKMVHCGTMRPYFLLMEVVSSEVDAPRRAAALVCGQELFVRSEQALIEGARKRDRYMMEGALGWVSSKVVDTREGQTVFVQRSSFYPDAMYRHPASKGAVLLKWSDFSFDGRHQPLLRHHDVLTSGKLGHSAIGRLVSQWCDDPFRMSNFAPQQRIDVRRARAWCQRGGNGGLGGVCLQWKLEDDICAATTFGGPGSVVNVPGPRASKS